MNHFEYGPEGLACEGVPLARIAAEVGTPVYVYSRATLERHFTVFRDALVAAGIVDPLVAYAVKANSNVAVLKVLGDLGAGADTVSEGEVRRALAAGIPGERIVFSGVGKKRGEIAFALQAGVAEINVESEPELNLIAEVAADLGLRAKEREYGDKQDFKKGLKTGIAISFVYALTALLFFVVLVMFVGTTWMPSEPGAVAPSQTILLLQAFGGIFIGGLFLGLIYSTVISFFLAKRDSETEA